MNKFANIFILSFILIISFYLRFEAYFTNNSFFTDEVLLFNNIDHLSYFQLIKPLHFNQSAPYIFLILSKFICNTVGCNELYLRFIPFLSSIISVILFYLVCKKIFQSKLATYIALFTFGISYQLLFYSQVFKQYSCDVLIVILFFYLIVNYNDKISSFKHFTLLGIFSCLCVFTSLPMIIILPAFYLSLIIFKIKPILKIIYASLFPVFGLIFYYILNIRHINNSVYLHNYWQKGFNIFDINTYKMNFDFLFTYYSFSILLLLLLCIGIYFLYKRNKFILSLFTFTILNTLILAYLKIYPCERRLILFLLPILLIISIYPIDNLKKDLISVFTIITSIIFFGYGYFNFFNNYFRGNINYVRQDVKPLLNTIIKNSDNKSIYVYYGALPTYMYYSRILNLPKNIYLPNFPNDENLSEEFLLKDIKNLPTGNYYILLVKGTGTYEKDLKEIQNHFSSQNINFSITTLKSASLVNVHLNKL